MEIQALEPVIEKVPEGQSEQLAAPAARTSQVRHEEKLLAVDAVET